MKLSIKIMMIPLLIGNIAAYPFINKANFLLKKYTTKTNLPTSVNDGYTGKIQSMIFLNNLK